MPAKGTAPPSRSNGQWGRVAARQLATKAIAASAVRIWCQNRQRGRGSSQTPPAYALSVRLIGTLPRCETAWTPMTTTAPVRNRAVAVVVGARADRTNPASIVVLVRIGIVGW